MKVLFEVEYEDTPIRHAYVTCPACGRKFCADDTCISKDHLFYEFDLLYADYCCPVCKAEWSRDSGDTFEIKEVGYPKCAEGALKKVEKWE